MTLPTKIQRLAATFYPITVLVLAVPIAWLYYKQKSERRAEGK